MATRRLGAVGVDDLVSVGKPDPIHCHHADVVAYIHGIEIDVSTLRMELANVKTEVVKLTKWVEDDAKRSAWFYDAREDIADIVASKRWVSTGRRMILFVSGTVAGVVMAWNALEIFIREHSK